MKRNKIPYYTEINLICTDGSTIKSNFLYDKDDIYLNPDIKSNNLWLPELMNIEVQSLSDKSTKYDNYEFDFESLVDNKE
jgi:hypothetical protein